MATAASNGFCRQQYFVDVTHIKTVANKKEAGSYDEKLREGIDADRQVHNKKHLKDYDCYLCPNSQVLKYSTINRRRYREYKSNPSVHEKRP